MDVYSAAMQRRSIRRFTKEPVDRAVLVEIADAARMSPTGVNLQPFQFAIVSSPDTCRAIFPHTYWAKRIADGSAGPDESTQPTAYVLILQDTQITGDRPFDMDAGAAAMSIMLMAEARGVANCWLANIRRPAIMEILGLDAKRFSLHTLVALGHAAMQAKPVPVVEGKTDYYLESKDSLCVPKRAVEDVIRWYE